MDLEAYGHQDVPFEYLVEALNPARTLAHHPLFQVMLALQNTAHSGFDLPGAEGRVQQVGAGTSRMDLLLSVGERHADDGTPAGLDITVEYNTDIFTERTVESLIQRWRRLLETALTDPDLPVSDIDLLTTAERATLLCQGNSTATHPAPATTTLPALLTAQAAHTPHAPAVTYGGDVMTYAELDARANRLARVLIARGVGPERVVAVCLSRTSEAVVALLAILKAGGAYLPVDPAYPAGRIAFMLGDAEPVVVLADSGTVRLLPPPWPRPPSQRRCAYSTPRTWCAPVPDRTPPRWQTVSGWGRSRPETWRTSSTHPGPRERRRVWRCSIPRWSG
ncbi:hypothetical protein SVIO_087930 [Streptomyces violaceusniger]|uniref:AMP-dependent synthetase/ligase domain-containing protein n=1 Tax=Streptomyces violaceusniger TaxID=68280 RepID=A0A4D4LGB1_STRVO|nr:hypothetical protein SVIO_087930 [Streptomyces violaceusniger]